MKVQKILDEYIDIADKLYASKEKEILEVSVPNTSKSYQIEFACIIEEKKKKLC